MLFSIMINNYRPEFVFLNVFLSQDAIRAYVTLIFK